MQMISSHIILFLSDMAVSPPLLEKQCHIPLKQSSTKLVSFHPLKVEILLIVERGAIRVAEKKSDVFHSDAERGLFKARPVGEVNIIT